mmetsp:Transcript_61936/g.110120  ORF Transcript_61936/g.110120 Transcript_61936/m.110120 type:complete len:276 (+) Transcript_61936:31-858(+)
MNSLTFLMRALTCAGTIALGSLPIALVGDMNDVQMGTSISVAAGMMSGCSVVLAIESLLASSCIAVVAGIVFGVLLIHGVQWMLAGREDLTFGDLKGSSALGAIVIFLSMLLHSLGEGLSIGVSASEPETSSHSTRLNTVVLVSLGIHNIPEGMAICMAYRSKGMSIRRAALCAFLSNLPQPVSALASFCCMRHLETLKFAVPVGLGMASGAMSCVVIKELAPEAFEKVPSKRALVVMLISALAILFFDAYHHFGNHEWSATILPSFGAAVDVEL